MLELTAENVLAYLIEHGRLPADEPATVELLAGGVSNVVFLVSPLRAIPFVLKQSRAQLRTQADWFSRLERIFREAEAQRALSRLLPAGCIPDVLFEDRENYCYAMTAVRPDHAVWKRQLLSGKTDHEVFVRAGRLLGGIHALTLERRNLLSDPDETTVFYELRIDPFYRRIAAVHPAIQPAIDRLIAGMSDHAICLVHADFSPKNLLVHPDGLTLVDHETVHYGDPAFDLGFFFSHLWLKAVALRDVRSQLIAGIHAAWKSYRSELLKIAPQHSANFDESSQRAVSHLAACLLSRVDGKSPVDYLSEGPQKLFVRKLSLEWLTAPPREFGEAFDQISTALERTAL